MNAWAAGLDISNYQPSLLGSILKRLFPTLKQPFLKAQAIDATGTNWGAIRKAGVEFTIIKASEGSTCHDPAFPIHYSKAKAAGVLCGAYHFLIRSTAVPIAAQVDNFISTIGNRAIDLPHALDVETHPNYGNPTAADVKLFLTLLIGITGKRPLIYTSPYFWSYLGAPAWGSDLADLWIAAYMSNQAGRQSLPSHVYPWARPVIWQWMSQARIAGISGYVDLNWYTGGLNVGI